tara:strand:- start:1073 stop:3295 length:2223 start_codon:yes stop_codon:yes gene_type:complete
MSGITIKEEVNVGRAKQLLSLPNDKFESIVWSDEQSMKGEKELTKEAYIKLLRGYCESSIQNDGTNMVSYHYSKAMKTDGRRFAKPFALQSIKHIVRGYLVGDKYIDYDMANCHPTLLRKMLLGALYDNQAKSFAKDYPCLNEYVLDRAKFLGASECLKRDILVMMNSSRATSIENIYARRIDAEFKCIQKVVFDDKRICDAEMAKHKPHERTPNKKGKFLNRMLCIVEDQIIGQVIDHYGVDNVSTLMFDGIHLPTDMGDQVETLNGITEDFGVTWTTKPFDLEINAAVLKASDGCPVYDFKTYEIVKEKFERNHFIVTEPLTYCLESDRGVHAYTKSDFKDLTAPIVYMDKDGKSKPIFDKWLRDPQRRSYIKKDFIPCDTSSDPQIYNTFAGFPYGDWETTPFDERPDAVENFKELLGVLCDHDPESLKYLTNYFADLVQNPEKLPGVGLLLKSKPGRGKDSLIDIMSNLIGHTCRTANPEDVVKGFNAEIKDALIVQINEMEGADGFGLKEKLKNLITEAKTTINDKFEKKYVQTNYTRMIICTNNMTPIEIAANDRRYFVAAAQIREPKTLFPKIQALKEGDDSDGLYNIMRYLNLVDLTGFDIRKIPQTRMLLSMKSDNVSPLSYYLQHLFVKKKDDAKIFRRNKKTGIMRCTTKSFYEDFHDYCSVEREHGLKMTRQTLNKLLAEIKVVCKQARFDGQNTSCYEIDEEAILDHLSTEKLDTVEVVEDDEDEWE